MSLLHLLPLANPDIWLGGHISADIWLGGNLICFPVSHVNLFVGGGPKSVAKHDGGMDGFVPWIRHCRLHVTVWTGGVIVRGLIVLRSYKWFLSFIKSVDILNCRYKWPSAEFAFAISEVYSRYGLLMQISCSAFRSKPLMLPIVVRDWLNLCS